MKLPLDIDSIKGFLAVDEGEALYQYCRDSVHLGPCLEVGSYCGKSTVYLGTAAKQNKGLVYALDHHRGSEEHQLGEEYHDPDLYDKGVALMDSFSEFRKTMRAAALEETIGTTVSSSAAARIVLRNSLKLSIKATPLSYKSGSWYSSPS